jgi:hypothetical protein
MNTIFVTRSVIDCVDVAAGAKLTTCDLQPGGQLVLLVLSMLTSALMLGSKLASFEIIRLKQQEIVRIEAERDIMLQELQEELEAAVSNPRLSHHVESIFAARRSRLFVSGPNSVLPSPVPAPTAEADDRGSSAGAQVGSSL